MLTYCYSPEWTGRFCTEAGFHVYVMTPYTVIETPEDYNLCDFFTFFRHHKMRLLIFFLLLQGKTPQALQENTCFTDTLYIDLYFPCRSQSLFKTEISGSLTAVNISLSTVLYCPSTCGFAYPGIWTSNIFAYLALWMHILGYRTTASICRWLFCLWQGGKKKKSCSIA